MTDLDMSQVRVFAAKLAVSPERAYAVRRGVAERAANKIKTQMRQAAAVGKTRERISHTITYDAKHSPTSSEVEVGPVKGASGSLAFEYFGNSKIGPRLPDPVIALRSEAPIAAEQWLKGIGDVL